MDSKKIGEAIKLARKKNKLSQKELSELCDIPVISIGRYERGERTPSINTLCDISEALGINPMDLMGEKENDKLNKSIEVFNNTISKIQNNLRPSFAALCSIWGKQQVVFLFFCICPGCGLQGCIFCF